MRFYLSPLGGGRTSETSESEGGSEVAILPGRPNPLSPTPSPTGRRSSEDSSRDRSHLARQTALLTAARKSALRIRPATTLLRCGCAHCLASRSPCRTWQHSPRLGPLRSPGDRTPPWSHRSP